MQKSIKPVFGDIVRGGSQNKVVQIKAEIEKSPTIISNNSSTNVQTNLAVNKEVAVTRVSSNIGVNKVRTRINSSNLKPSTDGFNAKRKDSQTKQGVGTSNEISKGVKGVEYNKNSDSISAENGSNNSSDLSFLFNSNLPLKSQKNATSASNSNISVERPSFIENDNLDEEGFNNQALLFENASMFGNFTKKIKINKEVPNAPIFKRMQARRIKKIPIEDPQTLENRFLLKNVSRRNLPQNTLKEGGFLKNNRLKRIISSICLILIVFSGSVIFLNLYLQGGSVSRANNAKNSKLQFADISIDKDKYNNWASKHGVSLVQSKDDNNNGLLNWQEFYLDVIPGQVYCGEADIKILLQSLTNLSTCKAINVEEATFSQNTEDLSYKQVILLNQLLIAGIDVDYVSQFSLTYSFGLKNIDQYEQKLEELKQSKSKTVLENLILISKINSHIKGKVNTFNSQSQNTIDGVYFLEASKNYGIAIEELLALAFADSTFGSNSDKVFNKAGFEQYSGAKNINAFGSFYSTLVENNKNKGVSQCDRFLIYNPNLLNCNELKNIISQIKLELS